MLVDEMARVIVAPTTSGAHLEIVLLSVFLPPAEKFDVGKVAGPLSYPDHNIRNGERGGVVNHIVRKHHGH